MPPHVLGIIIGGLIPAILFGIGNFLIKVSNTTGIGIAFFLASAGVGFLISALCLFVFLPEASFTFRSAIPAVGFGLFMGAGTTLVSVAIVKYGTPMSVLTPLFNMNTLVTVFLALWIFAEWKQVRIPQLLFGSALIVIGGALVARS